MNKHGFKQYFEGEDGLYEVTNNAHAYGGYYVAAQVDDRIRELEAESEALRKQGEWQPIESLPKGVEAIGAFRSCSTKKYKYRPVTRVNATDHDFESEGFEIANCWDVTHYMLPKHPPEAS